MFGGLYTLMVTLGLAAVKFLAFKGLLVAKVALVLAAINGLSRLVTPHHYNPGYYHVDTYGTNLERMNLKPQWEGPSAVH